MSFESWLAYTVAYLIISLLPGPSVLMVVGQALSKGRRAALYCVLGDVAGGFVVMTASYLGLGILLASSAIAFSAVKWAGVAYMAYLGLQQIRSAGRPVRLDAAIGTSWRAGFATGVLNPKAIMFYMAFLAQFIDPNAPQLSQFLLLMLTSTMIVALVLGGYAVLASRLCGFLNDARRQKHVGIAGGVTLLGGSALMAVQR